MVQTIPKLGRSFPDVWNEPRVQQGPDRPSYVLRTHGRWPAKINARSIGKNANPATIKFPGKVAYDLKRRCPSPQGYGGTILLGFIFECLKRSILDCSLHKGSFVLAFDDRRFAEQVGRDYQNFHVHQQS